ncbi:MAG: hypothetical protein IPJ60_00005, partial [Sphingobacteriaceae bacterium]|nr:hypothetical protein [Sphingobacteriaceae bacterium]
MERTPFLNAENLNSKQNYHAISKVMLQRERDAIAQSDYLNEHERGEGKMNGDGHLAIFLTNIFNHIFFANAQMAEGKIRLSFKATIAHCSSNFMAPNLYCNFPQDSLMSLLKWMNCSPT